MKIEERLKKLELELSRAKLINRLLAVTGIGVLLIMWVFAPGIPTAQEKIVDEIIAKRFTLVDGNGKTRARLHEVNDVTIFELMGVNSNSRAAFSLYDDGPRLVMFDKNGRPGAGLSVYSEGPLLTLNSG